MSYYVRPQPKCSRSMTNTSSLIQSIDEFITCVRNDFQSWNTKTSPWFRGEPVSETPLLPKLYRPKPDGTYHDENQLVQFFRMRAPSLGIVPPRDGHTDQWLCLAQHVGLPTRLLDWSEGALVALYFALLEEQPIMWMLHPDELNRLSLSADDEPLKDNEFGFTWVESEGNIANMNFRGAWRNDTEGTNFPVSIHPMNIHPRMSAQKSCFTIHGRMKKSMNDLVPPSILKKYEIDPSMKKTMFEELQMLGVSYSTIFPDLDGLAKDLAQRF